MSVNNSYLTYRGTVRALAASGKWLVFVTEHPEGHPTGLYRLNCESLDLSADPIPAGGRAICVIGETLWIGGTDSSLLRGSLSGSPPKRVMTIEAGPPSALAPLSGDRMAIASGSTILVAEIGKHEGTLLQSLELPGEVTCLAADPTGFWLVAGTSKGDVAVFSAENRDDFILSESSKLHEGAVTALLFDPDELRFLSSGADRKLLSTLARGSLEPEDRGKSIGHDDVITSIVWAPGDRFLTGARDSTVKTWPRSGGSRPATLKDGVAQVRRLAVVTIHDRPRLVVACEDNTLRLFVLDAAGKFGDATACLHDGHAQARHELRDGDPRRREAALKSLSEANDSAAIELLAEHCRADTDPALRLDAAERLGRSDHPRVVPLLEDLLDHSDERVRQLAFERLRARIGESDFRPIDLALKTGRPEVGRLAIEALAPLARRDEQAFDRLLDALEAKEWDVRRSAAEALEAIHPEDAPDANLTALNSRHADLRRWALGRLLHRGLLERPEVATALRRRAEDRDADVRRIAFLLMLHTRPRLLSVLRQRDADLDRQLTDLDTSTEGQGGTRAGISTTPETEPRSKASAKPSAKKASRKRSNAIAESGQATGLDGNDLSPLLNASASRLLDTSLRGARGLALLNDPRAFGLLLQLSREADPSARVEVCRALAELGDESASNRLRSLLYDPAPEVRDAAFTALVAVDPDDPLPAAEAGLNADHDDVRRRALQLLLAEARKAPPGSADQPTGRLLVRALNDGSPAIRAEAFKAALNLPVAGGGAHALRFARRSIHADVRREVLTEVIAQISEPWAWDLLLEAFDDPDPDLRVEAFTFASSKTRGLEVLDAALGARFPDLRSRAVAGLIKKHTQNAQSLLARALDDEDRDVRLAAIDALVSFNATNLLGPALTCPHADIRVRAARALARHGDRAALGPLIALAASPEPTDTERRAEWLDLASLALDGLAELGDPEAILPVLPLLDSPHAPLRKGGASVLAWCSEAEASDPLRQALSHADPHVKYRAAMGLALRGDTATAPLVDSSEGSKIFNPNERLAVASALGAEGQGRLALALDADDEAIRDRALILLALQELKAPRGDAARLITALSSRSPRVRLVAADALRSAHDPAALLKTVTQFINNWGEGSSWTIPENTVDALADLLVLTPPVVRARGVIHLLPLLRGDGIKDPAAFQLALNALINRYSGVMAAAKAQSATTAPAPALAPQALLDRAFGAYVGLVREQGERSRTKSKQKRGSAPLEQAADDAAARVRHSALDRLRALAGADPALTPAVVPVFLQALGDPYQLVRFAAFDHLTALGTDPSLLGGEALGSGHTDLGIRGLELLSGSAADDATGQSLLEQVMLSRKDDLAAEAARLLSNRRGRVPVAAKAVDASSESLRLLAISWLQEAATTDPTALETLKTALDSRYAAVRRSSAFALAEAKDPAAFKALTRLLADAVEPTDQARVIAAFERLGDPRAASVFLDRLENDPARTAQPDLLIPASSRFLRPEDADRLLSLMDRERKWRMAAFQAITTISGHNQQIDDPEDERPGDRQWMAKQHPRRDAILATLLDRCLSLGEPRLLQRAIVPARWALGSEVDEPLGRVAAHPDDPPRHDAIQAISWRLRKRNGPAEPLLKALQHPDPTTQFLAAEGLALAGRAEGISVLLSAIEFLPDLALRRRSVAALGGLEDARAFDRILQLASEPGHALQDVASEAVGHLGRGPKATEVFKLLDRQSRSSGSVAAMALRGLRWLGTRDAWARIREVADAPNDVSDLPRIALELLAFDDEAATRDLLLRHLRQNGFPECVIALRGARLLFGAEAIEPDESAAQNSYDVFGPDGYRWPRFQSQFDVPYASPLERLRERCEPARLFALMPRCSQETAAAIGTILLDRAAAPITEARDAIGSEGALAVATAARILGREKSPKSGPMIAEALARWTSTWSSIQQKAARSGGPDFVLDNDAIGVPECLAALSWAAGRTDSAAKELVQLASLERSIRPGWSSSEILRSVVEAFTLFEKPPGLVLDELASLAREAPPDIRTLAADAVARVDPKRAAQLAPDLIGDPVGFSRLEHHAGSKLTDILTKSAGRVHAQGVAVSWLVSQEQENSLAAIASDPSLVDAARLGAIEGLGALASKPAEDHLQRIGLDEANDESLRKAAWRARRRSIRSRDRSRNPRHREVTS